MHTGIIYLAGDGIYDNDASAAENGQLCSAHTHGLSSLIYAGCHCNRNSEKYNQHHTRQ